MPGTRIGTIALDAAVRCIAARHRLRHTTTTRGPLTTSRHTIHIAVDRFGRGCGPEARRPLLVPRGRPRAPLQTAQGPQGPQEAITCILSHTWSNGSSPPPPVGGHSIGPALASGVQPAEGHTVAHLIDSTVVCLVMVAGAPSQLGPRNRRKALGRNRRGGASKIGNGFCAAGLNPVPAIKPCKPPLTSEIANESGEQGNLGAEGFTCDSVKLIARYVVVRFYVWQRCCCAGVTCNLRACSAGAPVFADRGQSTAELKTGPASRTLWPLGGTNHVCRHGCDPRSVHGFAWAAAGVGADESVGWAASMCWTAAANGRT